MHASALSVFCSGAMLEFDDWHVRVLHGGNIGNVGRVGDASCGGDTIIMQTQTHHGDGVDFGR